MKHMTLHAIAEACGGQLGGAGICPEQEVTAITTDSRSVTRGCLFVAIPGTRVDGHDFIGQVMEAGAYAVLGERELTDTPWPYIRVSSSLTAVQQIARFYLQQLSVRVVGITGSVGKTSTKEMIASVLAQRYRVCRTKGNFNNALGLPLTVFRLRDEDEFAVLEMGISDFGEMHRLADIARPDTCVITNIGTCHLEQLGDRDGVLRAKTEIFDFLAPDGHIVLNGDDDKLNMIMRPEDMTRYGFGDENLIQAEEPVPAGLHGSTCVIRTPAGAFTARIPMPGRHMVSNAMAGTAVGLLYGLTLEEIARGIASCGSLAGRFHIIETGTYTVIDDCYNANPMSMKASLHVLQDGSGRRVALLGDMGELGPDEMRLHAEVGAAAAEMQIDAIYCAGPLTEALAKAAASGNTALDVRHFPTRDLLAHALPELIHPGDTILVKASHYMQFDRLVRQLCEAKGETP